MITDADYDATGIFRVWTGDGGDFVDSEPAAGYVHISIGGDSPVACLPVFRAANVADELHEDDPMRAAIRTAIEQIKAAA